MSCATWAPPATGSDPPSQKSFWTSTTISARFMPTHDSARAHHPHPHRLAFGILMGWSTWRVRQNRPVHQFSRLCRREVRPSNVHSCCLQIRLAQVPADVTSRRSVAGSVRSWAHEMRLRNLATGSSFDRAEDRAEAGSQSREAFIVRLTSTTSSSRTCRRGRQSFAPRPLSRT